MIVKFEEEWIRMYQEKAMNYTSMFKAPVCFQLKIPSKKKTYILPWRLSLQQIFVFVFMFILSKIVFFRFLEIVEHFFALSYFAHLAVLTISFGLTHLFLTIPVDGKRVDLFVKDYVLYFFTVILRKAVVYRGEYRVLDQRPLIYQVKKY